MTDDLTPATSDPSGPQGSEAKDRPARLSADAIADALRVVARADDGLVEAVQHADDAWCLAAVQWHPEMMSGVDVRSQQVFTWFVDAVTADAERRAAARSARITANPTHGTAQAAS